MENEELINAEYADVYCLGLAYFGILDTVSINSKLATCCIGTLSGNKIFVKENGKTRLENDSIFEFAIKGVNPIFAQMLLDPST